MIKTTLIIASASLAASLAQAAMDLTFIEVDSSTTTMSYTGEWENFTSTGFSTPITAIVSAESSPGFRRILSFTGGESFLIDEETGSFGPVAVPFSGTYLMMGRAGDSDNWGFRATDTEQTIYAPQGYEAATGADRIMTGEITFPTDLDGLGMTPGSSGTFFVQGETINWNASVVPEPGQIGAAMGLAVLSIAFIKRRRQL